MRGVVLAGGAGTRLNPLTRAVNKHLLPVYDRPMIFFALEQLRTCGISDVVLVTGSEHLTSFQSVLASDGGMGLRLEYRAQEHPGGIAQALGLAAAGDRAPIAVLLGDNVFEWSLRGAAERFRRRPQGVHLVLAQVADPRPYGVAVFGEGGRLVDVVEKPSEPPSGQVVTGMYFFDPGVFDVIAQIHPSARGELEITDVVRHYIRRGSASHEAVRGYWIDCGGSFDELLKAGQLVAERGANRIREGTGTHV